MKASDLTIAARRARRGAKLLTALALAVLAAALCAPAAFAAAPPIVGAGTNTPEGEGAIVVRGAVNPQESQVTDCEFLYGPTTAYGQSAPCESDPGAGSEALPVQVRLTGLPAGTTYHFAVRATNGVGTTESTDSTFATAQAEASPSCPNEALRAQQHSAYLPDCRAFELVSPVDKNGGEVLGDAHRTRAAADGSALGFASLSAFARPQGTGVATDFMAERTGAAGTPGWATHAITPPQQPLAFVAASRGMEPLYWGEFSENLEDGIFRSYSPLNEEDPNVANLQNLYLRKDLRSGGSGTYRLLTTCPACPSPIPPPPGPFGGFQLHEQFWLAGASADFRHVVFDASVPLTPESTAVDSFFGEPTFNVFESEEGSVRLVGLVPPPGQTECGPSPLPSCEPAPVSHAGGGAHGTINTPHVVSADGSRAIFTLPEESCELGFPSCGRLYMRIDHTRTIQLNASEKTNGPGPGGTDPNPAPVVYGDASLDGSRVFFTSAEALTNDAPINGDHKVYRYDVHPNAEGHHLTFVSADSELSDGLGGDSVRGVIGASADGSSVYWMGGYGSLSPSSPTEESLDDKIYRWHEGTVEYVGALSSQDLNRNINAGWALAPHEARVSPDGTHLLFRASAGVGLTGYSHGSCPGNGNVSVEGPPSPCDELYIYDSTSHSLECASCNPSGVAAEHDAEDSVRVEAGGSSTTYHWNHALSDDGRYVFFSTAEPLVSEDTNGVSDAYVYDTRTASVHLLSSGTSSSASYFMDAGHSGNDVFIRTRQPLNGWDPDGAYDLYDARVEGGFPEPPPHTAPCNGDSCRPSAGSGLTSLSAGSAGFQGQGNRKPKRCAKGGHAVRRHGRIRCVARHHHRKRPANHNRRTAR